MASSIRPPRDSSMRIRVAPEEVILASWPLRQQPLSSLAMFAVAGATSGLVGWAAGQWLVGMVAGLALATTLWRTWLPVRYIINGRGVTQVIFGRQRLIPWNSI